MVVAGSLAALIIGVVASRILSRLAPVSFLIRALGLSAVALVGEWLLADRYVQAVPIAVYVHFTALSGLFISGFWTVVSERFDPRTARRSVARIAAAGTAGGLVGGITAERIAVHGSITTMLLVLAVLNVATGFAVYALRPVFAVDVRKSESEPDLPQLRTLLNNRYVRLLIILVTLGAIAETCLDFVLMTQASATYTSAEALLRLFAVFYTSAAVLTMIVQLGLTRRAFEFLGLAPAAATLPAGVAMGSAAAIMWPGLAGAIVARGTELVLRNSLFRSAYELLGNALLPREKRAAKTVIDVTAVRFGRIVGSIVIQGVLIAAAVYVLPIVLATTIAVSIIAVALLPMLQQGHVEALESHLVRRAPTPLSEAITDTGIFPVMVTDELISTGTFTASTRAEPLTREAVPGLIARLDHEQDADDAVRALEIDVLIAIPALAETLRTDTVPFTIRRRVAQLLGTALYPAARDALLDGLRDPRFEIRYRCGRALTHLVERDGLLSPTRDQILDIVSREVDVGRRVWDRRHLTSLLSDEGPRSLLGVVLQERTDRSLEHVFRLLALVLPAEPLLAAFRGLQSADVHLRGTALDYLEFIVPVEIRRKLWKVLESDGAPDGHQSGPTTAELELDALVKEQPSIMARVEELRKRER